MQFRVRKAAHVLERIGLAMAGAASGLFVGAHVGSSIAAFTSLSFLLLMMISGAVGFLLRLWLFMQQMIDLQKAAPVARAILQNSSLP